MFKWITNLFGTPIEMCPTAQRDALMARIENHERTLSIQDGLMLASSEKYKEKYEAAEAEAADLLYAYTRDRRSWKAMDTRDRKAFKELEVCYDKLSDEKMRIEQSHDATREVLGERIEKLQRELDNPMTDEMKKLDGAQALNGMVNALDKLITDYLQVIDPAQRGDDGAMTKGAIKLEESANWSGMVKHGQQQASVMRVLIDHLMHELADCNLPRVKDLLSKMNSHDIDDGSLDPDESEGYEYW